MFNQNAETLKWKIKAIVESLSGKVYDINQGNFFSDAFNVLSDDWFSFLFKLLLGFPLVNWSDLDHLLIVRVLKIQETSLSVDRLKDTLSSRGNHNPLLFFYGVEHLVSLKETDNQKVAIFMKTIADANCIRYNSALWEPLLKRLLMIGKLGLLQQLVCDPSKTHCHFKQRN